MEVKTFIDRLFEQAKAEGFEACEVCLTTSDSFSVNIFKDEITRYSASDDFGLGFRGLFNGKMGYASTQILDDDAIDLLVGGAKTNAQLVEDEDEQFLCPAGGTYAQLDLWNDGIQALTPEAKIQMARALEEKVLGRNDPRVTQTDGCSVFSGGGTVRIVNTLGLDVSTRSNMLGGYIAPTARDGERTGTGFAFRVVARPEAFSIDAIADEACQRALEDLRAEPVPSGHMDVILAPEAAADLLATFSGVFSAEAAQKGLSLLRGREGECIAAPCVTLLDNPLLPDSPASAPFDGEGCPTKPHTIIEKGTLRTLLHNLKTAHKQGVETTGNASRSYNSTVGVAPTNFYFAPGTQPREALIRAMGEGLILRGLEGLHAGANPISGDFSLSAGGYLVSEGQVVRPVKRVTVAGNFYRLLQDVSAVGADLEFQIPGGSRFGSPSLLIKNLSIAGED